MGRSRLIGVKTGCLSGEEVSSNLHKKEKFKLPETGKMHCTVTLSQWAGGAACCELVVCAV